MSQHNAEYGIPNGDRDDAPQLYADRTITLGEMPIYIPETSAPKLYLTWEQVTEQYNENLDEGGPITICGGQYMPSDILQKVDNIAYRVGLVDYADFLSEEYDIEGF